VPSTSTARDTATAPTRSRPTNSRGLSGKA
jgi:hypothetical protein